MLTFRTFRNSDPPAIAALWRRLAGQPGIVQPVSSDLLEQLIFAKLYFDYRGLVLAHNDGRLVGFAHAGFGPNADETWISTDSGTTCVVATDPDSAATVVISGLLDHCEEYLRKRGAKTIFAGGLRPLCPFFLGLYGGSELPGVLDHDASVLEVLSKRGYHEVRRTVLFQRTLDGRESPIDRQQMQIRRQMQVEVTVDKPTRTWWEACTFGEFDLTRFELVVRGGGTPIASSLFRTMEPSGTIAIGRGVGLIEIAVDPACQRRGLATFLLNEAFRQFLRQGIMHVEAQTTDDNTPALGILRKLGLEEMARGGVWKKQ